MRLKALLMGWGILFSFSAWGLSPLTSCKVLPSSLNLPMDELIIQLQGQDRALVHFHMNDEDVTDACKISEDTQNTAKVMCWSAHGYIEITVGVNESSMKMRAIGRSGRMFNAVTPLACNQ
jgi:hypothetical protein